MMLRPSRLGKSGETAAPDVRRERLPNGVRDLVYFGGACCNDTALDGEIFSREAATLNQPRALVRESYERTIRPGKTTP